MMLHGLVLALAAAATVQTADTAEINALPLIGQLRLDVPAQDSIRPMDLVRSGRHVRVWAFRHAGGRSVTIDLRSDDFDALLFVTGPGFPPLRDDDGGGGCHARITFTPAVGTTYRVGVTSLGGDGTGGYTLLATQHPAPADNGACVTSAATGRFPATEALAATPAGRLTIGDTARGRLDPVRRVGANPAAVYALTVRAGETVTIDLRSQAFDAYLGVVGPGLDDARIDDDGAGLCDARLTVTFPLAGEYRVVASSFTDSAAGPFTLVAMRNPGPMAAGSCADAYRASPATVRALPISGDLPRSGAVRGTLRAGQDSLDNGSLAQAYRLRGRAGERWRVTLRSRALDTYLLVEGPGLYRGDDDGGGRTDACLVVTLPADGDYRVVATSFARAEGTFTLSAAPVAPGARDQCAGDEPDEWAGVPVAGTLVVGEEVAGTLDRAAGRAPDGGLALTYRIDGVRGQAVTIDLLSGAFDAALFVMGPGITGVMWDDDSAGACNARLTLNFPATATYRVVATTMTGGSGPFVLRATQLPGPVNASACRPGQ